MTETAAMDVKAIWRELHDKLQGFIARRIANPDDAEDILQEVFLRVHSRIATLSDAERVNGWVYQIARNTIIDHYRSNGHKTDILTERDESEWTVADDDSDTERLRRGLAASLVRMVSRLPEPYAEAIRLTELDGLTQKAAAERVGISLSGMKSRVQRGREKLKQMLLECCHFAFDSRGAVVGAYERNESCACCEREGECGCE